MLGELGLPRPVGGILPLLSSGVETRMLNSRCLLGAGDPAPEELLELKPPFEDELLCSRLKLVIWVSFSLVMSDAEADIYFCTALRMSSGVW